MIVRNQSGEHVRSYKPLSILNYSIISPRYLLYLSVDTMRLLLRLRRKAACRSYSLNGPLSCDSVGATDAFTFRGLYTGCMLAGQRCNTVLLNYMSCKCGRPLTLKHPSTHLRIWLNSLPHWRCSLFCMSAINNSSLTHPSTSGVHLTHACVLKTIFLIYLHRLKQNLTYLVDRFCKSLALNNMVQSWTVEHSVFAM